MATQADVRRIALSLAGTKEAAGGFAFEVQSKKGKRKGFAWVTEPHYDGYAAVLVRLAAVRVPELRELLTEAWRCQIQPDKR